MKKFIGFKTNTCRYVIDDNNEDKKAKVTKRCVIKRNINLKIIKTD